MITIGGGAGHRRSLAGFLWDANSGRVEVSVNGVHVVEVLATKRGKGGQCWLGHFGTTDQEVREVDIWLVVAKR